MTSHLTLPCPSSVGASALVRVQVKTGALHEDVGYGTAKDRCQGTALERARKVSNSPTPSPASETSFISIFKICQAAVTDARKRALRCFGELLGNSLKHQDDNSKTLTENLPEHHSPVKGADAKVAPSSSSSSKQRILEPHRQNALPPPPHQQSSLVQRQTKASANCPPPRPPAAPQPLHAPQQPSASWTVGGIHPIPALVGRPQQGAPVPSPHFASLLPPPPSAQLHPTQLATATPALVVKQQLVSSPTDPPFEYSLSASAAGKTGSDDFSEAELAALDQMEVAALAQKRPRIQ